MSEEADSGDGHGCGNSSGVVDDDGGYSLASEVPGAPCPEPLMTETNCRRRARYQNFPAVDSDPATREHEGRANAAVSQAAAKAGLTGVGGFGSVGGGVSRSGEDGNDNYKSRESDSEGVSPFGEIGRDASAGACANGAADVGGGVLLAQRAEDAECGGEAKATSAPILSPATGDYISREALEEGVGKGEDSSMKVSRRASRGGAGGECGFDELSISVRSRNI